MQLVVSSSPPRFAWAAALVALVSLSACGLVGTTGEGAVTTETRQVGDFSQIDSVGGFHVTVATGPTSSVEVSAQSNIIPLVVTEVVDGSLHIHSAKSYTSSERVDVNVTTPQLGSIELSGGSRGEIDGLSADTFEIQLSGGSVLAARGTANTIALNANGGSIGELDGLTAATVDVDVSGGSRVEIRATDHVNGTASGGSHVTVTGGAEVNVSETGGSQVEQH